MTTKQKIELLNSTANQRDGLIVPGVEAEDEIYGCTDHLADNFDPTATKDNGT